MKTKNQIIIMMLMTSVTAMIGCAAARDTSLTSGGNKDANNEVVASQKNEKSATEAGVDEASPSVDGKEAPALVGVATVGGVTIEYRCTPVPEGAQRFYVEVVFENRDVTRAPNLPDYATPLDGLSPVIAGVSDGSGTGAPLGEFSFFAQWVGYRPGPGPVVISGKRDIFRMEDGELFADELFTGTGTHPPPNAEMHGAFTFTGGTGRYANAFGSASGFAKQLGDGVHTAFVACGWIGGL